MASWTFEPGHTEAAFRARHMMVTWVRGLFKDVHGRMEFDSERPLETIFDGEIDATKIWTGEPDRDAHLSADFLDVESHPSMVFAGRLVERIGDTDVKAHVDLTLRGVTLPLTLDVSYLGEWQTPFWVGDESAETCAALAGSLDADQPRRLRRRVAGRAAGRRRRGERRDRAHPGRRGDPRRRA
jgi:polyisoprenoid-binding protein YceI